ncbi:glycosyltransferase family 2 protein [Patescibacteria group bacterium]|nr:glycosyltransferase family 2 protein [Patescibacteria group bacterium]MBU0963647.1 glycosyltransferase family 2 protein [Patescibacteria group bacterium]
MDVSIIIVSWNVKDHLTRCLRSIFKHTDNLNYEVFVVDNNSIDGSAAMVKSLFPAINLIINKKNIGFAAACNQAIKESKGNNILLLNPDTEITDNAIYKTSLYLRKNIKIGIVGCRILNEDGTIQPSVRRFPDLISHICILLKLHNFFPEIKSVKKYYMTDFKYNSNTRVEQVMGAFFMIKRELLKSIGLLDKHFYIWYEEVDFCKRAVNKGWQVYYYQDANVIHHKGKSFEQVKPVLKQSIFNRSMLYYFFKHHSIFEYLVLLILFPTSLILALIVQLLGIKSANSQ